MTKKRYEPNVGAVIFAPVVVSFTIAKQTLKRLHSVNEWLNTNEPEVDQTVVNTLDAGLGLLSAGAKATLVASSFGEGFVEAICENNNININAPRKEQVAGWKKTCKEWFKEEEKKEEAPSSYSSLQQGVTGEMSVKFTDLVK
jgi:hypothetical protein